MEEGEFFRECAIRETEEEVGISVDTSAIQSDIFVETRTAQGIKMYYFGIVRDWDGMPENIEPHKHLDARWFALDDLPQPFVPHHLAALDCYKKGNSYTEIDVAP